MSNDLQDERNKAKRQAFFNHYFKLKHGIDLIQRMFDELLPMDDVTLEALENINCNMNSWLNFFVSEQILLSEINDSLEVCADIEFIKKWCKKNQEDHETLMKKFGISENE